VGQPDPVKLDTSPPTPIPAMDTRRARAQGQPPLATTAPVAQTERADTPPVVGSAREEADTTSMPVAGVGSVSSRTRLW